MDETILTDTHDVDIAQNAAARGRDDHSKGAGRRRQPIRIFEKSSVERAQRIIRRANREKQPNGVPGE